MGKVLAMFRKVSYERVRRKYGVIASSMAQKNDIGIKGIIWHNDTVKLDVDWSEISGNIECIITEIDLINIIKKARSPDEGAYLMKQKIDAFIDMKNKQADFVA